MIHSILLMGQSNMAGRGNLDEVPPLDATDLKVFRNGRWFKAYRPVNPDRVTAGVNLSESFARRYLEDHPGVTMGIIPAADGGTRIAQWVPGSLLYDHALYQVKLAERTSTIVAILWHQGESDIKPDNGYYEGELYRTIDAFRKDAGLSDVPFIAGALGDYLPLYGKFKEDYRTVNEMTKRAVARLPLAGYASAEGLTPKADNLHFDSASLLTFGERYYEVFKGLEVKDRVFVEKPNPDDALRTSMEEL